MCLVLDQIIMAGRRVFSNADDATGDWEGLRMSLALSTPKEKLMVS
jgi:hypothetical protein